MKRLVLVRIDDRLIHGQVATQWLKKVHANKVLIVDEKLPSDEMQKRILKAAAPPGIKVLIKNIEDGVIFCKKEPKDDEEKVLVLVKFPYVIEEMLKQDVAIPKVILGGMGYRDGRERINRNVSATQEELECMRRIRALGTEIAYQLVPDEAAQNFDSVLNK